MKTKLLLIFLLINHVVCFGQSQLTNYYNNDFDISLQKDAMYYAQYKLESKTPEIGKIKIYSIVGKLKMEWTTNALNKNNLYASPIDGEYISYFENNAINRKTTYKSNLKNGIDSEYFENGKLKSSANYVENLLDGENKQFDKDGNLLSNESFSKGTGTLITFHDNNNKESISKLEKGIREGLIKIFNNDEELVVQGTFKSDSLNGPLIEYYSEKEEIKSIKYFERDSTTATRIECNEYGNCKIIIENKFNEPIISQSSWTVADENNINLNREGLLVKGINKNTPLGNTDIDLNIPWINYEDFTIEAEFIIKDNNTEYGLYWNENKTENSYSGFVINTLNKGYEIETFDGTIYLKNKKGLSENIVLGLNQKNSLSISKKGNDVYYSVNGIVIDKETYKDFKFNGKRFSIYIAPKDKKKLSGILVKRYNFKDDIDYKSVKSIAEDVAKSGDYSYSGNGSGFYISSKGYIATNYHVIDGANEIQIETIINGEAQSFLAEVVKADKSNDLAIIRVIDPKFKELNTIPYNFFSELKPIGTSVFTLGYPYGGILSNEVKFTNGNISSNLGIHDEISLFQISAPIQPGNSGGPVFDENGDLIGIIVSTLNRDNFAEAQNVNFAIKATYLKNLVDVLPETISLPNTIINKDKSKIELISELKKYVVKITTKE
jgi:S1-C subfamily serine protease/antitoxin component YwqK of YwqJK toxin-antitoxin module